MLNYLFTLVLLMSFSFGFAQNNKLVELRTSYIEALHDCDEAERVYDIFLAVENPSAKMLAYRAALEAIMTKTTWNLFKKINYLNKSETSFNKAIEMAPDDVEIRFMRMAVQYEIPEYLGYSEDMEEDRKFIVKNIDKFNPATLEHETLLAILDFMKKCNRFTPDQIEKFKGILALK
ncbi:MAG: hypothetical protein RJQ00_02435 [Vicingaceae bacterium]